MIPYTFRALPLFAIPFILTSSGCQQSKPPTAASPTAAWIDEAPPAERLGVITARGKELTLVGLPVKVGDDAPAFTAVGNDMATYTFDPKAGKVTILSSVPSVDTPTCSVETKRFNDEADKLGPDVAIVTVSMDLPFAQKRWCAAEGVKNLQTVSDYRDRAFGKAYGTRIKENGLLARTIHVVGKDGKVAYVQTVAELSKEPDYAPVLAAAKAAAGR